jgi:pyruvate decarboxylase
VPGDYNLPLLDGLAQVPGLTMVNTANELNAGYAADGHARARGIGCVVTTFLVGALSAINAAAASFAEEVPVLCVVGVPNTSQYASTCALHHTLGNLEDISQEVRVCVCVCSKSELNSCSRRASPAALTSLWPAVLVVLAAAAAALLLLLLELFSSHKH